MKKEVMERHAGVDLRALVVWVPMRGADENAVPDAANGIADPRAQHFWDGRGETMQAYSPVLGIRDNLPAWDVYLVYPAGARWEDGQPPPPPDLWMHQLNHQLYQPMPGPFFDSAIFSDRVLKLAQKK